MILYLILVRYQSVNINRVLFPINTFHLIRNRMVVDLWIAKDAYAVSVTFVLNGHFDLKKFWKV